MTDPSLSEDMHRQVEWMVPADPVFLNFLYSAQTPRGKPSIQTPKTIAANTGYSNRHASARCLVLVDHDLVERIDEGEFRLADRGVQLIEGEVEPEEL